MRLLTHNYLQSNVKGTENGFPLKIRPTEILYEESQYDKEFVQRLIKKIDYNAIKQGRNDIETQCIEQNITLPTLPDTIPTDEEDENEEFLRNLHYILFNIHIQEGQLICPGTGREFTIKDGIPNMILHEDEL